MSWRLATKALHAAGGGPIRRRDFWPPPASGADNSRSLYRAKELGMVSGARVKFAFLWTLTQRGIDWCEGRIPEPKANAPHLVDRDTQIRRLANGVDDALSRVGVLTPRQHEIMVLVAVGLSSREIAQQLSRDLSTVERHRERLMRRLGVQRATEVAVLAAKAGLV